MIPTTTTTDVPDESKANDSFRGPSLICFLLYTICRFLLPRIKIRVKGSVW